MLKFKTETYKVGSLTVHRTRLAQSVTIANGDVSRITYDKNYQPIEFEVQQKKEEK